MCGIWAFINPTGYDIKMLYDDFMKIKHRGPDFSSFQNYQNLIIGFHRLSIMDLSFISNQPYTLRDENRTIVFVCNGEIYNYKNLIKNYDLPINTKSDCMTIPQLYMKLSYNNFLELFIDEIKGEFSFLLFEFNNLNKLQKLVVGRDAIGVRPLYYSEPTFDNQPLIFSSEIKGCASYNYEVKEFPPGNIMLLNFDNNNDKLIFNFNNLYTQDQKKKYLTEDELLMNVKNSVIDSISRRLDSDQPMAFLLSGGVDSSLIASLGSKLSGKKIRTFCCGMNDGSDLKYARLVAEHIGSEHTEVIFTPEEALETINDVIYTTETWDTTTIRASVGQYLVSKYISQNTDAKVLFVGEGPDEVCSSYLFNYYAPDTELIHPTAIDYVKEIHYYDIKRCDRCISRWGLEARVALLDPEFIEAYWNIPSNERHPKTRGIEKWWLRKAFAYENLLPEQVLWRKKEAFSDGVSGTEKSWFQIIQEHIKEKYNMDEKEYYKQKFIEFFGNNRVNIIPHYWQPKWNKDGIEVLNYVDPSARTLEIYTEP
jgi:asparagine synthase (glutamine-hydrolysing)